jgi:hypothetical protein
VLRSCAVANKDAPSATVNNSKFFLIVLIKIRNQMYCIKQLDSSSLKKINKFFYITSITF